MYAEYQFQPFVFDSLPLINFLKKNISYCNMEGDKYRKEQLDRILFELGSKIKSYRARIKQLSRVSNGTTVVSLSAASIAASLAAASFSVAALPITIVTICLGSTCAISTGLNKIASTKLKKYQAKLRLAEDKHAEICRLISDSLKDNSISMEEFDNIIRKYVENKSNKQ